LTRARLTVCLIARDEAARIGACLASVRGAVDETIVVDTGSRDDTPAIARAAGATVLSAPWTDDFSAARNVALGRAHGDWVLSLDADETLPAGTAARLRGAVARAAAPALRVPIQNLRADGAIASAHLAVRLFRREPAHRWVGRVHEQVTATRAVVAPLPILHHGYADRSAHPAKLARNRTLLERAVAEGADDPTLRYHLAATCLGLGDHAAARDVIEAALASAPSRATELRMVALDVLARVRLRLGDTDGSEAACREALTLRPDWIDPRLLLGRLARRAGRAGEAIVHLGRFLADRARLAADPAAIARFPRLWSLGDESIARAELALVHHALGDRRRAEAEAARAHRLAPDHPEIAAVRARVAPAAEEDLPWRS
jgi:glycosyltransferase involved in cell wall biosynthesis